MPKLKSSSAAKKRFSLTASGKLKASQANKHIGRQAGQKCEEIFHTVFLSLSLI